jgi:hypothetical protein
MRNSMFQGAVNRLDQPKAKLVTPPPKKKEGFWSRMKKYLPTYKKEKFGWANWIILGLVIVLALMVVSAEAMKANQ